VSLDGAAPALERGEVVRLERLGGGILELTARLPRLAANTRPGQFAQLRCGPAFSPLLRRPFSVAWTEAELCSFVFEVVGAGTRLLAQLHPGDELDSLGPLGRGFTLDAAGAVVCVSGGLGCAPFPILCRALRARGVADITVLNGAATAARLYPAARFARGDEAVRVVEATDDGSRGSSGRVTDLVVAAIDAGTECLYACGPNPMLVALAALLAGLGASLRVAEASLEAPMGCGYGTCLGCALPVRASRDDLSWALCCSDGPVMPIRDVAWNELAALPPPSVA
jgi:dihydroorotate dehydrogenase electron transfer subunit